MAEGAVSKLVTTGVDSLATRVKLSPRQLEATVVELGSRTADSLKHAQPPKGIVPTITDLLSQPIELGARMLDAVTGHTRVHIDTHTVVKGTSPAKWADEFLKDPSQISPIASGARKQGETMIGKPFPLGPDIGITLKSRHEGRTAEGLAQTTLEVQYSGAFEGRGRITITQRRDGTLDIRDQWNDVLNRSLLPGIAAQNGHPLVAGLGFQGIGSRAAGQQDSLLVNVGGMVVSGSIKAMTAPFALAGKLFGR